MIEWSKLILIEPCYLLPEFVFEARKQGIPTLESLTSRGIDIRRSSCGRNSLCTAGSFS